MSQVAEVSGKLCETQRSQASQTLDHENEEEVGYGLGSYPRQALANVPGAEGHVKPALRIAFDLDETLGVPIIEGSKIVGWQLRPGCKDLLDSLGKQFALCLWSVASRRYVDKALSFGLKTWFREVYTWDELPAAWKDVRRIAADYLVDDSPHHQQEGTRHGLASAYVVVPAYGSPEDVTDPTAWVRIVRAAVRRAL